MISKRNTTQRCLATSTFNRARADYSHSPLALLPLFSSKACTQPLKRNRIHDDHYHSMCTPPRIVARVDPSAPVSRRCRRARVVNVNVTCHASHRPTPCPSAHSKHLKHRDATPVNGVRLPHGSSSTSSTPSARARMIWASSTPRVDGNATASQTFCAATCRIAWRTRSWMSSTTCTCVMRSVRANSTMTSSDG